MSSGWLKTACLVLATLLLVNAPLVLGTHTGRWDASDYFAPYYTLIADHARQGQLLLWTPLVEGGAPAGFDPQIGAMSPLTVGMAAATGPCEAGFRAYWLVVWALGGLGVVVLARHLTAPAWAGYVAGVGYMFSSVYMGHAEHTPYLVILSFFPWCLWRLDVALVEGRFLPAAEAGAIWGLAALSGYPGLLILGFVYLGLWTAGRLAFKADGTRRVTATLAAFAVMLAVSLVVLSPVYVGFLAESRGHSDRGQGLDRATALRVNALDPRALLTFASPALPIMASLHEPPLWLTDVSTCGLYLFPVLPGLALAGLCASRRCAFRWYLLAVGLGYLVCALGDATPLRGWLYDWLPPMRYFRHSGICRCYWLFTLVVLFLLAAGDLREILQAEGAEGKPDGGLWRRWLRVSIVAALGAAAAMAALWALAPPDGRQLPGAIAAAVYLAVAWFGPVALLAWVGRRDAAARARLLPRGLVALVVLDAVATLVLSKPTVYTSRTKLWAATEAAHQSNLNLTDQGLRRQKTWRIEAGPENACLLAKVPVLKCNNSFANELHRRLLDCPVLLRTAVGDQRVWFSPVAAETPQDAATFECLAARAQQLGQPCLVVSPGRRGQSHFFGELDINERPTSPAEKIGTVPIEDLPPAVPLAAKVRHYDDCELVLDIECPADGWLLVTDRWAPGWRVWRNDEPAEVRVGNLLFLAVKVEAGPQRVAFRYEPAGYPGLLVASWMTLAVVGLIGGYSAVRPSTGRRIKQDQAL